MARINAQEHNMTSELTYQNEPHYVVIEGTNIRDTLPGRHTYTPKVYDSHLIAQTAIDVSAEIREHKGLSPIAPRIPISVVAYNEKYAGYQDIERSE